MPSDRNFRSNASEASKEDIKKRDQDIDELANTTNSSKDSTDNEWNQEALMGRMANHKIFPLQEQTTEKSAQKSTELTAAALNRHMRLYYLGKRKTAEPDFQPPTVTSLRSTC